MRLSITKFAQRNTEWMAHQRLQTGISRTRRPAPTCRGTGSSTVCQRMIHISARLINLSADTDEARIGQIASTKSSAGINHSPTNENEQLRHNTRGLRGTGYCCREQEFLCQSGAELEARSRHLSAR